MENHMPPDGMPVFMMNGNDGGYMQPPHHGVTPPQGGGGFDDGRLPPMMSDGGPPQQNLPPSSVGPPPPPPMGPNDRQFYGPMPGQLMGGPPPMPEMMGGPYGPPPPHHGPPVPVPYMPRNMPMIPQIPPHYRINDMNKRLQTRPEENNIAWWDSFVAEFFTDNASLTFHFIMDDGPKRYSVGRGLIPRYFYTIFDSGCCELYYLVHNSRNAYPPQHIIMDSEATEMVMNMMRPFPISVVAEGHLSVEFVYDEMMRIRNWIFLIRSHRELPSRTMMGEPPCMENMNKRITRNGMTAQVLNFLRLCVILEPMQELMSRQKAYSLSPRDCLKTTLFQKWQRMVSPPEQNRSSNKRRKRKNASGDNANAKNNKRKQPLTAVMQNLAVPGDIMIVGEPTLMGNSFGENDERMITRLENSNFSGTSSTNSQQQQQQQSVFAPPPPPGPGGYMMSPGSGGNNNGGLVGGPPPPGMYSANPADWPPMPPNMPLSQGDNLIMSQQQQQLDIPPPPPTASSTAQSPTCVTPTMDMHRQSNNRMLSNGGGSQQNVTAVDDSVTTSA